MYLQYIMRPKFCHECAIDVHADFFYRKNIPAVLQGRVAGAARSRGIWVEPEPFFVRLQSYFTVKYVILRKPKEVFLTHYRYRINGKHTNVRTSSWNSWKPGRPSSKKFSFNTYTPKFTHYSRKTVPLKNIEKWLTSQDFVVIFPEYRPA